MANNPWYCDRCRQRHMCTYLRLNKVTRQNEFCPPLMDKADGNVPRKEDLTGDLWDNGYTPLGLKSGELKPRDYKEECIELGTGKVDEHTLMHDNIMAMPDDRRVDLIRKTVAALAFFEISASKSMRVLGLAERTFYRYFRGK